MSDEFEEILSANELDSFFFKEAVEEEMQKRFEKISPQNHRRIIRWLTLPREGLSEEQKLRFLEEIQKHATAAVEKMRAEMGESPHDESS